MGEEKSHAIIWGKKIPGISSRSSVALRKYELAFKIQKEGQHSCSIANKEYSKNECGGVGRP